MATLRDLDRLLRTVRIRLVNSVSRAIVELVSDANKLQLLQLSALAVDDEGQEIIEDGEHFQPYGFFSIPLAGAEAVILFPNGDRAHPLVLAVSDRRSRPTSGQGGESGLYTDEGDEIRLARGHVIVLNTTGQVKLGSSSATSGVIKGTQRDTAEQTFLTALSTFVTAIVVPTGASAVDKAAMVAAITAFKTAVAAAISTKVKVE